MTHHKLDFIKGKFSVFLIVFFLVNGNSYSQIPPAGVEHNYLEMKKYVVAIGTVVSDTFIINGKKVGVKNFRTVGTGLLTYIMVDTILINCIVTAGHVVRFFTDNKIQNIYYRPSWADTIQTTEYFGIPIPLVNADQVPNTYLYPESHVDLGCILQPAEYDDSTITRMWSKSRNLIFPYNNLTTPYLGDQVWVGGYPEHIQTPFHDQFLYTISTFKPATIAWKPSKNMTNLDLSHITLIESNATHGNSGGPVFAIHDKLELVGILTSGYYEGDTVYLNKIPLIDSVSKAPIIANVRAGVSIIERAEYVKRLLEEVRLQLYKLILHR